MYPHPDEEQPHSSALPHTHTHSPAVPTNTARPLAPRASGGCVHRHFRVGAGARPGSSSARARTRTSRGTARRPSGSASAPGRWLCRGRMASPDHPSWPRGRPAAPLSLPRRWPGRAAHRPASALRQGPRCGSGVPGKVLTVPMQSVRLGGGAFGFALPKKRFMAAAALGLAPGAGNSGGADPEATAGRPQGGAAAEAEALAERHAPRFRPSRSLSRQCNYTHGRACAACRNCCKS